MAGFRSTRMNHGQQRRVQPPSVARPLRRSGIVGIRLALVRSTDVRVRLVLYLRAPATRAGAGAARGVGLHGALHIRKGLHGALARGDAGEVRRLLASNADVSERGARGMTPLMVAAMHGRGEMVELLLECGAGASIGVS